MRHAVADSYSGSVSPAALLHHHPRLDRRGPQAKLPSCTPLTFVIALACG
jgi:hypothetical protein